jgi:hypothetical protein
MVNPPYEIAASRRTSDVCAGLSTAWLHEKNAGNMPVGFGRIGKQLGAGVVNPTGGTHLKLSD